MDVTFVLEESGVTATVEVPCEANAAAAKKVACTALAVPPASVEMRIGAQVVEGTCRLQDTAFVAGVQVVLARPRCADIKCPAEKRVEGGGGFLTLSSCGALCLFLASPRTIVGFDTEACDTVFSFDFDSGVTGPFAISQCKTRCYLVGRGCFLEATLPCGEVLRKVYGVSQAVFACGSVVVSQGKDGVSVYDEDLTLLRSLSHRDCTGVGVSHCGGWVVTSSWEEKNARIWDVNTGVAVACVPTEGFRVALSRSASVLAVEGFRVVQLHDWSGEALGSIDVAGDIEGMQFTPCGKYLVVKFVDVIDQQNGCADHHLCQYDVATMSCVRVFTDVYTSGFAISPCSRVLVLLCEFFDPFYVVTRHLYPHNSE